MSEFPDDVKTVADGIAADIPSTVRKGNRPFISNVIARAIMADRATLSSAAVAEREPAYWAVHSKTGMHIGLWPHKSDADEALRGYEGGTITTLYLDPPPVSELGAENARLKARIAELEDASDETEIENGLTSDGSLWRWWSSKCREVAAKNTRLEAHLAEALKVLDELGRSPSPIQRLGAAVSRRDWQEVEAAYTVMRDVVEAARRVREGGKDDG